MRQRFGGGQQYVRRPAALARLLVRRCIAAAALDADIESHVVDRPEKVALDVGRQRLERRDVKGVQPVGGMRSEEHTSELQSIMRSSNAVVSLKKKNQLYER